MSVLKETLADVHARIDNEGFDYCFRHYSDFKGVDDPVFHRLRLAYIAAANALEEYVEENAELDYDDSVHPFGDDNF